MRKSFSALFNLFFPQDCRVCKIPLTGMGRVPVCPACLLAPRPFLSEYFCAQCATPFLSARPLDEQSLCGLCRRGVTEFERTYSYGEYTGVLKALVHLFKYGGVRPLAQPLGKLLLQAIPRQNRFDCIVPMPLHWRRRWKRGFNQCDLLAREISVPIDAPVFHLLRRNKNTAAQAGLTGAQRRQNVAGAFSVTKGREMAGKHVLLLDDVFTTGATVNAAAKALKHAGAARVTVATLARVDRRSTGFLNV